MLRTENMDHWVDSYVRNGLNSEEMAAFETAMLDSPELQQQLEAALAIQRALLLESGLDTEPAASRDADNHWHGMAMAAAVVLAVFSTTMYWKTSNHNAMLRSELAALRQPRGVALTVPVDIMRSAGTDIPDVIIQKPGGDALLVLDVELSQAMAGAGQVHLVLRNQQDAALFSFAGTPTEHGRLSVAFNPDALPVGQVWLEMSAHQGQAVDRRLLEFR